MKTVEDEAPVAPEDVASQPYLAAGEQYVRHPRTRSIRPADNLRSCADDDSGAASVCSASSEAKDKYVAFGRAKPAPLLRQPTHLKVEGEFEGASETKEKYVTPPDSACRAPLQRRDTQLQLDGNMQLASENADSFRRFENAQRARLQRRHTTLELPANGDAGCASEYNCAYHYPERYERARLMRSLENLHADGEMEFRPEYASSFVDFQVTYPQIKYRERRRSLVEAHRERHQQQCMVKAALAEGAGRPTYSPEYRHSYVRFPARRPTLQRPHTNLVPPPGIGETESQLKAQLREVWQPKSAGAPHPATTSRVAHGDARDAGRSRSRGAEMQQEGDKSLDEKPFCILPDIEPEGARKNVNFVDNITSRQSENTFRKGQRLPAAKCCSEPRLSNLETSDSKRPTFRLEVTNPDHQQKAFEKQQSGNAPFVVLDENNNTNRWIKNKQQKKQWTPSWMKV